MNTNRYSRQMVFPEIGPTGQARLKRSTALVIGCGALGTISASLLTRAGVGKIRIIDRDYIEMHNLQRQVLFDEEDISLNLPKAIAAQKHLQKVNSEIEIEGIVADVNPANIEKLVAGADVILDGLDNMETRFLINDVALKMNIPWVYGGALASQGMSFTVLPWKTACYRCIVPGTSAGGPAFTCDTAGVLSPAPGVVASLQTAEVLKILTGSAKINPHLVVFDVWENNFDYLRVAPSPDCPACQGRYEFLEGRHVTRTLILCGQNAVQVLPAERTKISLPELAGRLGSVGQVTFNDFMLVFSSDTCQMLVFPDARAIIKNTENEVLARALYARFIGA